MKYLWIIILIIIYIVLWIIFVLNVINEIGRCKRADSSKPSIIDFLEWIFDNDYIKAFLIAHAVVLFIVSLFMFFSEG